MFDEQTASAGGEIAEKIKKPKLTRAERVEAYQTEHYEAYRGACREAECRCSPTKAESLIIDGWLNAWAID